MLFQSSGVTFYDVWLPIKTLDFFLANPTNACICIAEWGD